MNTLATLGSISLLAAMVACAPGDAEPIDKPLGGKADSTDRMCELIGEPADCDICDLQGWYDDGECDVFCTTPDGDCAAPGTELRIFASSVSYSGDLGSHTLSNSEGLAAGDELCNVVAEAAQIGGNWYAFLSTSTVHAATRVQGTGPWVNMNGDVAFPNVASYAVKPSNGLGYDEHGWTRPGEVWTGTQTGGTSSFDTCWNWTNSNNGHNDRGTKWRLGFQSEFPGTGEDSCGSYNRLLCMEAPSTP